MIATIVLTEQYSVIQKQHFTEQSYNAKNYVCLKTFGDILENLRTVKRFQNKNSVMVSSAISLNGKLPLKFIHKGLKINVECYKLEVLATQLLLHDDRLYPSSHQK